MKVSLVVPCYNEEKNVKLFANKVEKVFKNKYSYEIIFINDGSKDGTITELKKIAKNKNQKIKIINFSRNFGKEAGIYAGLKEAKGDYINIIDADLQQNPKFTLEMVDFLENNPDYDIVTAYQKQRHESKIYNCIGIGFVCHIVGGRLQG